VLVDLLLAGQLGVVDLDGSPDPRLCFISFYIVDLLDELVVVVLGLFGM
jgi:hypothetical protein